MRLWPIWLLAFAVLLGALVSYLLENRQERQRSAPRRRLIFMLLVAVAVLAFSMHYRSESMYDRGKADAFRESYLAGQAHRAAGLPMDPYWDDRFDTQAYLYLANGLFNDIVPYCKGRMVWRGCGYEKGYLGHEPRLWENGRLIDLTVP